MSIILITGNKTKLKNANLRLNPYGIKVLGEEIETPEIQSTQPEEIAEYSARYAQNIIKKPVIKLDVSFEIDALKGFPGPFVKYINQWLEPTDILKMIGSSKKRSARFIDVVHYFNGDENESKSFKMIREGIITEEPLGENGWGVDKIFIPTGFEKTLAQMDELERSTVWGNENWENLASYLKGLNKK